MGYDSDAMSPVPTGYIRRCSRHMYLPGVRFHHATEHAKQCGFARSVGPENGEQLTGFKLETYAVHGAEPPKTTDEAYRLQSEAQITLLDRIRASGQGGHLTQPLATAIRSDLAKDRFIGKSASFESKKI